MSVSLALRFLYLLLGCNFKGIPANRDTTLPGGGGGVQIRREKAEKGIEIELLN